MLKRFLTPNNRSTLIATLLLLGFVSLSLLITWLKPTSGNQEAFPNRSIYNSAPSGYRAWYLASKKAGLPITPWKKSFNELDQLPTPATILMVEPFTVARTSILFSTKQSYQLLQWVAQGNTLILLDDFRRPGAHALLELFNLGIQIPPTQGDPKNTAMPKPLQLSPQAPLLGSFIYQPILSRITRSFIDNNHDGNQASPYDLLLFRHQKPVLIRLSYGAGSLILGTPVDLGDNLYLHGPQNDNYQFLTNLLRQEGRPIYINEFIHGYEEAPNLFSYYQQKTPIGAMLAQLGLAFIFMLWLSFVRWTPQPDERVIEENTEVLNGLGSYIQSMATIYQQTQSSSLPLSSQLEQLESTLQKRFRLSLDEEARLKHLLGNVFADYSSKQASPEAWVALLKKAQHSAQSQEKLPNSELLRLMRELSLLEERLHNDRPRIHTFSR